MALTACSCNYFELAQSPIVFDPGVLVGIGTTTPAQLVEIAGANEPLLRVTNTAMTGSPYLELGMNQGNNAALFQTPPGVDIKYYNGQYALTILGANGNVGIGTTAPSDVLTVHVPASGTPVAAVTIDVESFGTGQNEQASHFLQMRDVDGGVTRFFIRGDGNVGIGTASPGYPLDVAGTIRTSTGLIAGGAILLPIAAVAGLMDSSGTRRVADENGCYYAA